MASVTARRANVRFNALSDREKVFLLLLIYTAIGVALVAGLGLEGGSMGGFTGLSGGY